jgi:hypothetical protein
VFFPIKAIRAIRRSSKPKAPQNTLLKGHRAALFSKSSRPDGATTKWCFRSPGGEGGVPAERSRRQKAERQTGYKIEKSVANDNFVFSFPLYHIFLSLMQ